MVPDVSIVIPTYNRADHTARAVASVREPDLRVEIIVVDDGSTDETESVFRDRADIRYVRLPQNSGAAAARNAGIEVARAPLVAFLDSDDTRLPGTLALQLARLEQVPEGALVYGGWRGSDGDAGESEEHPPEGDVYDHLLRHCFIRTPTVVARAEVLKRTDGFDTHLWAAEEYDLWLRIAARQPVCAVPVPVAVIEPAMDPSHLSGDPVAIEKAAWNVLRAHLGGPHARPLSRQAREEAIRAFQRVRIDRMTWRLLEAPRPFPQGLILRGLLFSLRLQPSYMLKVRNLKTMARLVMRMITGGPRRAASAR